MTVSSYGRRDTVISPFLSLRSLWRKPAARHKDTQAVLWRGARGKEQGLLPTASTKSPVLWLRHIFQSQSRLQKTASPTRCWLHMRPQARTVQLSCNWIPNSQKLCEIINAHCFKLLSFEVIFYKEINN